MAKDINALLEKLNFSEEESKRVYSSILKSNDKQGYETWAVGRIMLEENINRDAMYRVSSHRGSQKKM